MKHLALVLLLAGCEGLTSTAQPTVSVLRQTADGCFALMTPAAQVDPGLNVAGTCGYIVDPRLVAGIDLVELVIDYGPDVEFAGSSSAPAPTISLTVDGALTTQQVALSDQQRIGGRAFFIATVRTPAMTSADMRITAGVNAGFQTTVPVVFSIVPPLVSLTLTDCPLGLTCELPGAVGSAHFTVSVPGDLPQRVTIHTTLDGVPQPDPPDLETTPSLGQSAAIFALPVPAAHGGALWVISAVLETSSPTSVSATIREPTISAQLSCGDTCSLAPGEAVGLEIDAPAGIRPLQALVDTRLDGVPILVAAPVTLLDRADGTSSGVIALHAPSAPGSWQIDVSVAGYTGPAIVTTVQ